MTVKKRRRKVGGKPTKASMLPYKMLIILLYGRFTWVERDSNGTVRVSVPEAIEHLNIRRERLWATMETLEDWGLVSKWRGRVYLLVVTPVIPAGMAISVNAHTIEAEPVESVTMFLERGGESGNKDNKKAN